MTPWTPSTSTPLKSPSSCLSYPRSWSGTSPSWSSQVCLSPTSSTASPLTFRSSSSRWACADRSHHTWQAWRPATEEGPAVAPGLKGWFGAKGYWQCDCVGFCPLHQEWSCHSFMDLLEICTPVWKIISPLFVATEYVSNPSVNGNKVCWRPKIVVMRSLLSAGHILFSWPFFGDLFSSRFVPRQSTKEGMFAIWSYNMWTVKLHNFLIKVDSKTKTK